MHLALLKFNQELEQRRRGLRWLWMQHGCWCWLESSWRNGGTRHMNFTVTTKRIQTKSSTIKEILNIRLPLGKHLQQTCTMTTTTLQKCLTVSCMKVDDRFSEATTYSKISNWCLPRLPRLPCPGPKHRASSTTRLPSLQNHRTMAHPQPPLWWWCWPGGI